MTGADGSSDTSADLDNGVASVLSPVISLPSVALNDQLLLRLWYYFSHNDNGRSDDYFRVTVIGESSSQTVFELWSHPSYQAPEWTTLEIPLENFAGQEIQLLIEAAEDSSSRVEAGVDDVEVIHQSTAIATNLAPEVSITSITSPNTGPAYQQLETIGLTATAIDEAGDLSGFITWNSSLDGSLGTGESINLSNLSIGSHSISAEITDSENLTGSDLISIEIIRNQPSAPVFVNLPISSSSSDILVEWQLGAEDVDSVYLDQQLENGLWKRVFEGDGSNYSHQITSLDNGSYKFRLLACNSSGCSSVVESPSVQIAVSSSSTTAAGVFGDDFESDKGWTVLDNSSDGAWERGDPEATTYQLEDAYSGTYQLITGKDGGSDGSDNLENFSSIRSPNITIPELGAEDSLDINFWYYLSHNRNSSEDGYLRISVIGDTYSRVVYEEFTNDSTVYPVWQNLTLDISDFSADTVYLLVEAEEGSGSRFESGIDDIEIVHTAIITNQPPQLTVSSPSSGDVFSYSSTVNFLATATDEDGDLSSAVEWNSSADGILGTGANLDINSLSVGSHTITAEVADSSGLAASQQIDITVLPAVPAAPTFTSVPSLDNDGAFDLAWQFNSAWIDELHLEQQIDSGAWTQIFTGTGSDLSYSLSGLTNSSYLFRIQACNVSGCSGYTTSTATVVDIPDPIPDAPTTITVPTEPVTSGGFTVSWATASGVVDSYELEQQLDGGSWSPVYSGTALSHSVSSLAEGSYLHRVRACNTTGCSSYNTSTATVVEIPDPIPEAPATITVPASNDTGDFTVTWAVSTGVVDSYLLEQQLDGGAWTTLFNGLATSHELTGLTNGSYQFRVSACNTTGCSTIVDSTSTLVSIPVPSAPVSIDVPTTTVTTGGFTVSWAVATGVVGYYELEQEVDGSGAWTPIYSGSGTSKNLTDLANGDYRHRVRACNSSGCSDNTTSITTTVGDPIPGSPTTINVPGTVTNGVIDVSWPVATGVVDYYELEQKIDTGSWVLTQNDASTSYLLNGAVNGNYLYRVRACNATGCSAYAESAPVLATDPAPDTPASITVPTGYVTDGAISISWGIANGVVDRYELERQLGNSNWEPVASGTETSYADTGLANGDYLYRIRACNTAGCSPTQISTIVVVTDPPPTAPVTITVPTDTVTTGEITVSWDVASGVVDHYELEQQLGGGGWSTAVIVTGTSHTYTGLSNGSYLHQVRACNLAGCSTEAISVPTLAADPVPAAPVTITVPGVVTDSVINISWDAAPGVVEYYELEYRLDAGNWSQPQSLTTTSHSDTVSINGDYIYRVRACNATGCSGNTESTSILVTDLLPPGSPGDMTAPAFSNTDNLEVTWAIVNGQVDAYVLEQQLDGSSTWNEISNGINTSFTVVGLQDGTYSFRTYACNASGCSGYSAVVTTEVNTNVPDVPSYISVVPTGNTGDYTINWDDTGASKYYLETKVDGGIWDSVTSTSSTSRTVTELADGSYQYRVRACNGSDCSEYITSGVVDLDSTTLPPRMEDLVYINPSSPVTTYQFDLEWEASLSTNVEWYELEYRIYSSKANTQTDWQLFHSGNSYPISYGRYSHHIDTKAAGLITGNYGFRVRACNSFGCSPYSEADYGNYILEKPSNLTINLPETASVSQSYNISWNQLPEADTYTFLWRQLGVTSWTKDSGPLDGPIDSINWSESDPGVYQYGVETCNVYNSYQSCTTTYSHNIVVGDPSGLWATPPYNPTSFASMYVQRGGYSDGQFYIRWSENTDNPSGATNYEVYQQIQGGTWEHAYTTSGGSLSASLEPLPLGTYKFRVRACTMRGCADDWLESANVVIGEDVIPSTPSSFYFDPISSLGNFEIEWSASYGATSYQLDYRAQGGNSWTSFPATSYSEKVVTLAEGAYYFRVTACNGQGCSAPLESSVLIVDFDAAPAPPSPGLINTPPSDEDGSFHIYWPDVSSDFLTHYELDISSGSEWPLIYSGSGQSYDVASLSPGDYSFRVRACNNTNCSLNVISSTTTVGSGGGSADTKPGAPSFISAPSTNNSGDVTVSWGEASGTLTHYLLSKTFNGNADVLTIDSAQTSHAYTSLEDGSHSFQVSACNNENCSAPTDSTTTVVDSTVTVELPGAPGPITAPLTDDDGSFPLSWTAATGIFDYYVLEQSAGSASYQPFPTQTTLSFNISGLDNGTYHYRVKACNSAGCTYNNPVDVIVSIDSATTPAIPNAPEVVDTNGSVAISWISVTDADSYQVEKQVESSNWQTLTTVSTTSHTDTNVSDGVNYAYRISACNGGDCSIASESTSITVSITQGDTYVPSAPAPFDALAALDSLVPSTERDGMDQIGSVAGSFRVNESGAATYSIPIATAAGTAGVVPQISLNYSSSSGNGLMGLGWSIGGLSGITRCRQTLHQDGQAKPINWTEQDRFCLDGQRLLLVSGTYGAPGSTYKTEIDSFALVSASAGGALGQPDYFTVERKDGSTSYYGYDDASTNSHIFTSDGSNSLSWAISKFEDSVGNPIWFVYNRDSDGHRISEIHYAYGSDDAPTTGYNAHIEFSYETNNRPDPISGYIAGENYVTNKRLAAVKSYNGSTLVRQYNLTYLADHNTDKLSRLSQIQECSTSSTVTGCLPPTTFSWELPQKGFALTGNTISFATASNHFVNEFKFLDVNGDGRLDLAWNELAYQNDGDFDAQVGYYALALESGGFSNPFTLYTDYGVEDPKYRLAVMDYNADGRQDLLVYKGDWQVYLSTPNAITGWRLSTASTLIGVSEADVLFADINSDGLVDVVETVDPTPEGDEGLIKVRYLEPDTTQATSSSTFYHFGTEDTFTWQATPQEPTLDKSADYEGIGNFFRLSRVAGDLNGDGMQDVITSEGSASTGGGGGFGSLAFLTPYLRTIDAGAETYELYDDVEYDAFLPLPSHRFVDINQDGLSDFVQVDYDPSTSSRHWYYALNSGDGFEDRVPLGVSYTFNIHDPDAYDEEPKPQLADINGDGYPDVYWPDHDTNNLKATLWNPGNNTYDSPEDIKAISGDYRDLFLIQDVTGDGIVDFVTLIDNDLTVYPGSGSDLPVNLVTSIENGLTASTDLTYDTLSGSDHYERLTVATVPSGSEFCLPYGGTCYPFMQADSSSFYSALNGGWNLPAGSQTLGKSKPVLELNGPIQVVTRVESSAPVQGNKDAKSAIEYYYAQARIQASGRGYLGFEQLKTVDVQTGVETTTVYRQDWPFIGYPARTEVRTSSGDLLSEAENTWELKNWSSSWVSSAESSGTASLGPVKPFIKQSIEKTYDLASTNLIQTVTTDNVYDDYGNPTSITVTTEGSGNSLPAANANFQKVTTNTYGTTTWQKEKGRLSHTTVVSKRDDDDDGSYEKSGTRESSFTYYTSGTHTGLLETETIEPNNSAYTITTTHSYDNFGNKVRSATIADSETRCDVDTVVYDTTGRHVKTTYDCLGRKLSEVMSRNKYGAPLEVQNYIDTTATESVTSYHRYTEGGAQYFSSSDSGAWQATTLHSGAGGVCPSGTIYYSKVRSNADEYTNSVPESRVCYDKLGRETMSLKKGFSGNWIKQSTAYDDRGRVDSKSIPYYSGALSTVLSYDDLGRITAVAMPDSSTSSSSYDGFITTITNDAGQKKQETRNALGELVKVVDNLNGSGDETSTVTYTYDAQGNLETTTDSANNTTTIHYDLLGRKEWMHDPDKGGYNNKKWYYDYNGFGELTKQTDAKGQASVMAYDGLGRMVKRIDCLSASGCNINDTYDAGNPDTNIEGFSEWTYDTATNGLGQLDNVEDSVSGYIKAVEYDSLGRPIKTGTSLGAGGADGDHYEKVTYDEFGRTFQVFDAARESNTYTDNGVEHRYNNYGYLEKLVDAVYENGSSRATYRTIQAMDAWGNVTDESLGNNVTTTRSFFQDTGRIDKISSSFITAGDIQDLDYHWDTLGNLEWRIDQSGSKNLTETFGYDGLNRLTSSTIAGGDTKTVRYDALGNIKYKSDVCLTTSDCYGYGSAGPHAVTLLNGVDSYSYDDNGNNTGGDGRTIGYTTFDKAKSISKGGHTTTFEYGPDRARYKRVDNDGVDTQTTLYIGSVEKIFKADGSQQVKRYIGGVMIETESFTSTGTFTGEDRHWTFKDHLGSTDVITDSSGNILTNGGELSFDPWGQRRSGVNWADVDINQLIANYGVFSSIAPPTTRGFTGHEMVDEVGIIHMNGRIYDPRLARFLQADPIVQSPFNTQSLNRYSYVWNNPLNATDPSGYSRLGDIFKAVVQTVITVVVGIYCAPCAAALAFGFAKLNGATSEQAFFAAALTFVGAKIGQAGTAGGEVASGGAQATADTVTLTTETYISGGAVTSEVVNTSTINEVIVYGTPIKTATVAEIASGVINGVAVANNIGFKVASDGQVNAQNQGLPSRKGNFRDDILTFENNDGVIDAKLDLTVQTKGDVDFLEFEKRVEKALNTDVLVDSQGQQFRLTTDVKLVKSGGDILLEAGPNEASQNLVNSPFNPSVGGKIRFNPHAGRIDSAAHEVFHPLLGPGHAFDGSGSIRSYDAVRGVIGNDVRELYEIYYR